MEARMLPRWPRTVFTAAGVLLVALGILHLAVLPLIKGWFLGEVAPTTPRVPAFLLDHVVSGLLLLPLGGLTVYAARALPGERWARVVCLVTAITVLALPVATVALMGTTHLRAWPFALAVGIMSAAAILLLVGAVVGLRQRALTPGDA